jgi:hypothetical protein
MCFEDKEYSLNFRPLIIELFVAYCKHLDYNFTLPFTFKHAQNSATLNTHPGYQFLSVPDATVHAEVYQLAEYLGAEGLMDAALTKLQELGGDVVRDQGTL